MSAREVQEFVSLIVSTHKGLTDAYARKDTNLVETIVKVSKQNYGSFISTFSWSRSSIISFYRPMHMFISFYQRQIQDSNSGGGGLPRPSNSRNCWQTPFLKNSTIFLDKSQGSNI